MGCLTNVFRFGQLSVNAIICALTLIACCNVAMGQPVRPGAGAIATTVLGELPPVPLYWHMDNYPNRATAERAKGARSTVAEAFGKVWLFTIAEVGWRPIGGEHVAKIGPLPIGASGKFTASYLVAATQPGFETDIHQHGGPEALYTLSGEVCLETPQGKVVGRAGGEPLLLAGDLPMRLTSVGQVTRRSIVLVLHDSSQPWKVPANGWAPKGLCNIS